MSMMGKSLIHYEITAEIGKGGMGEVYQAKDTKLGRDVAIKVLPEEFALDTDRVARFQREAKLLASLNHPNISAIHGMEESDGTHFLVMELVEGDTLRDRIKSGPIPVEEALKLALQMAEALEAAHEKGVIHRDLKPANIKVTPDGKVKILDFGLAKAYAGDQGNVSLADSPTISAAGTQQGVILGTAAYMSPEQAKGKPVDKRADIWAFGVVLFEMLTGKSLFSGEDVSSTLARVLEREPDFSNLPQKLHPRIQFMLERCLKKDPKDRYSGISDARVDIQSVLTDPSGVFVQPASTAKPRKKLRMGIPLVAAIALLCLIVAGVAVWYLKPTEPSKVIRLDYDLPEDQNFNIQFDRSAPTIAISPDGSFLAFTTHEGLYLRSMNDWTAKLLPGTEGAIWPFFAPDSQWVGYVSNGKLKKNSVDSNSSVTICDASADGGFSWTSDNRILQGARENIMWVPEDGGELEALFKEEGKLLGAPQMLPDGESILFTTGSGTPHKVMVRSSKFTKSKELFYGGFARYIKTGHIVYGDETNLYARPFDLEKLEVTGGPIPLVDGVLNSSWVWHYAISDLGTLIYIPGVAAGVNKRTLVWVDREGKEKPISAQTDDYRDFEISPDGTQIALSIRTGRNQGIYIGDIALKNKRKLLTFDTSINTFPLWTSDGKSIVFTSKQGDRHGLYRKSVDGTGEIEPLSKPSLNVVIPCTWSKDGRSLVLIIIGNPVGIIHMEGNRDIEPLLQEISYHPMISPDGQWIAYVSVDKGRQEVFVRPFPEVNKGQWKVSTKGGFRPLWSRDGRELFYWTDDSVMVVEVLTTSPFKYEKAKTLFRRMPTNTSNLGQSSLPWDIHPDGKRFLMMKPFIETGEESEDVTMPQKINIVLNWFEELNQRVPVD